MKNGMVRVVSLIYNISETSVNYSTGGKWSLLSCGFHKHGVSKFCD
jgi:hypothetical protein